MSLKKGLIVLCSLLLVLTLILLVNAYRTAQRQVVYLNMKAVIATPTAKLAKSFPKQSASMMSAYMNALPQVISQYARNHHVMIVSAVVLAGSDKRDITPDIMQATLAKVSA